LTCASRSDEARFLVNRRSAIDICFRSIAEIAGILRAREVTSLEITRSLLDRIDAVDGALGSYVTVCADRAMEQARDADRMFDAGATPAPLKMPR